MTLFHEPDAQTAHGIVAALGAETRTAVSLIELSELAAADRLAQLVVLGPGVALADALVFAGKQRLNRPTLGVVLLRERVDVTVLAEAIRAGVREVVDAADANAIRSACQRSLDVSRQMGGVVAPPADPAARGRVVTVFAGKGGCGKSTLATNLAIALDRKSVV